MRAPKAIVVIAFLLPGCGSRTGVLLDQPTDASAPDAYGVPDAYVGPDIDVPPPLLDAGGDAPSCNGAVVVGEVPPSSRPVTAMCGPSGNPYGPDAGPVACGPDAGCPYVDGGTAYEPQCIGGACLLQDECFSDSDCTPPTAPAGSRCACSSEQVYPGVPVQPNTCVPAKCRVDSDCGPGRYCVLSPATLCGPTLGFYCTTSEDRCVDPSKDCIACKGKACVYEPQVGWWVCNTPNAGYCLG